MESSEEATMGIFAIGPSTVVGRAIALRVLFCKSIAELKRILVFGISVYYEKSKTLGGKIYRRVVAPFFYWLHPRNPHAVLALIVGIALILRRYTSVKSKAEKAYRRKFWRNLMRNALTYDEWSHAARMLEKETPKRNECDLYDEELVKAKLHELQLRRHKGGLQDITFCLRADLVRNLGNMCNPDLHKGRLQVPGTIKEYIDEVSLQLRMVCDSDSEELPLEEKLSFMHETRHVFGRTALLLSGGASLGAFHVGVVKTLIDNHLLPRVVAGASVGSIICAVIATRTWPELQSVFADSFPNWRFFDQLGGIFATLKRLLTQGAVHEIRQLQRMLRSLTGNLTFQEAYDMTGRVLGISVCSPRRHEPPRCLNYLTSPHVVIWSAVTASCAFPGLFQAQELMAKDRHGELVPYHTPFQVGPEESGIGTRQWIDGSLESDLPMMQLKELFNVNHFIVSQANPHIAPLLRFKEIVRAYGGDFAAKLAHLVEMEVKHRCNQILELGFPLGGVAKLFAQDWEGDVTVVMPATLAQFAKIIQNPTYKELEKAINQGRRCTWEKLSAIKANCGIELVLDECVSLLNRMHRQRKNTGRAAPHGNSSVVIRNAAKRIPSWNCMARENSWGSLDEEGLLEAVSHQGGPWGGPSGRSLRFPRNTHDGSDSESDMDHNVSWTRVGGPLMRTASATTFIQSFDVHWEFNKHWNREEVQGHDDSEGSAPHTSQFRDVPSNNSDSHSKWNCDKNSDPTACHLNSSDKISNSDADDQSCSFHDSRKQGSRLLRSPSTIAIAEGDLLLAERSPSGTMFNVVKREDTSPVNRYHDVDTYSNEHTYTVDECIQLDSPFRDEDDNPITSPECSALNRDSDACILVAEERYGIEKKCPDEFFHKVERTVDLSTLCRQHAPENDKADLSDADGASNVRELECYIENELSEGYVRKLVDGNRMIGLQPLENECRAPQLMAEPVGSNDKVTYRCCGRGSCMSEDSISTFQGDNPNCIDKAVNSFDK